MSDALAIVISFWGFGYDSSTDDYKIVLGIYLKSVTNIHVLSLKTKVWKFLGSQPCMLTTKAATFFNGVLHWLMVNQNSERRILTFDLSREEFKEYRLRGVVPDPKLGVAKGCLCLFSSWEFPFKTVWLMKEYYVQQSWTLVPFVPDERDDEKEAIHFYDLDKKYPRNKGVFHTDHIIMSSTWEALLDPIFVPSLVSPRVIYTSSLKRKREPAENNDTAAKV
uniref:F-box/kelch-repeat protein At3g23880-like n=1 Tax=Erigeron canadensis TaxID=72917 RepID=UPI001CB93284|nr:F-box/kelch-repeat protein At3g23880-like [Erigeron canadensis]